MPRHNKYEMRRWFCNKQWRKCDVETAYISEWERIMWKSKDKQLFSSEYGLCKILMWSSFKIKIGQLLIKGACKKQLAKWTRKIHGQYLDEYTKFELLWEGSTWKRIDLKSSWEHFLLSLELEEAAVVK